MSFVRQRQLVPTPKRVLLANGLGNAGFKNRTRLVVRTRDARLGASVGDILQHGITTAADPLRQDPRSVGVRLDAVDQPTGRRNCGILCAVQIHWVG